MERLSDRIRALELDEYKFPDPGMLRTLPVPVPLEIRYNELPGWVADELREKHGKWRTTPGEALPAPVSNEIRYNELPGPVANELREKCAQWRAKLDGISVIWEAEDTVRLNGDVGKQHDSSTGPLPADASSDDGVAVGGGVRWP